MMKAYDERGLENLAFAVVEQAVIDYKVAVKNDKEKHIKKIEKFFRSKYGGILTLGNAEYILNRVKKELN